MASFKIERNIPIPPADQLERERLTLIEAAEALRENDKLRAALRESDSRIRTLCRQYDKVSGATGFAPHHLRNACIARGIL
jgi:hypothetical protein